MNLKKFISTQKSQCEKYDYEIILLFLTFFYLFFLPDLSFISPIFKNSLIIVLLVLIFGVIYYKEFLHFIRINKYISFSAILIVLANIYTLGITVMNKIPINYNITGIIFILKLLLFMILFSVLNVKKKINKIDFIINVFFIQGIICLLMLFIPFLKNIANSLYINNFPDYYTSPQLGIVETRIYGIASDYTFSLAISLALVSIYALILFFKTKNKGYLLKCIIMILGSCLNGRTGFLIFICCLVIVLVINLNTVYLTTNIKKLLLFLIMFCISVVLFVLFTDSTWKIWFVSAFQEIINLFIGKDSVTISAIKEVLFFPENTQFIFGIGAKVFGDYGMSLIGRMSDIGYVNDIFRGGLVYVLVAYSSYLLLCYVAIKNLIVKNSSKNDFIIIIFSFLFLFISNFKGESFSGSSIYFVCLFIQYVYLSRSEGEKNE